MKVTSVNVGLPRTVRWKGKAIRPASSKMPSPVGMHFRTL